MKLRSRKIGKTCVIDTESVGLKVENVVGKTKWKIEIKNDSDDPRLWEKPTKKMELITQWLTHKRCVSWGCVTHKRRISLGCVTHKRRISLGCVTHKRRISLGCVTHKRRISLGCVPHKRRISLGCVTHKRRVSRDV